VAADAEHVRAILSEGDRFGHGAACAPNERRGAIDHRHHGIIGALQDGPIMGHDQIRDAGQHPIRLGIGHRQRVAAGVAAGRYQGERQRLIEPGEARRTACQGAKDQVMHWG
jgi:hypothetical protein